MQGGDKGSPRRVPGSAVAPARPLARQTKGPPRPRVSVSTAARRARPHSPAGTTGQCPPGSSRESRSPSSPGRRSGSGRESERRAGARRRRGSGRTGRPPPPGRLVVRSERSAARRALAAELTPWLGGPPSAPTRPPGVARRLRPRRPARAPARAARSWGRRARRASEREAARQRCRGRRGRGRGRGAPTGAAEEGRATPPPPPPGERAEPGPRPRSLAARPREYSAGVGLEQWPGGRPSADGGPARGGAGSPRGLPGGSAGRGGTPQPPLTMNERLGAPRRPRGHPTRAARPGEGVPGRAGVGPRTPPPPTAGRSRRPSFPFYPPRGVPLLSPFLSQFVAWLLLEDSLSIT
jgi:hypothetical protein